MVMQIKLIVVVVVVNQALSFGKTKIEKKNEKNVGNTREFTVY